MNSLTDTELKQVRQYLAPNTRTEVDAYLRTRIPINPVLAQRLSELLRSHKEATHGKSVRRA